MSLKENVSYIKEEISTEEQFFESFFKIEKFYKKYKIVLFSVLAVAVIGFIGVKTASYFGEKNQIEANSAYTKVLENNSDQASLDQLKNANEELYNIALFQINKDKSVQTNAQYLSDIASYNSAVEKGDLISLDGLVMKQDFLLKDFAILSKALILIEKKDYKKAKVTIEKIDQKSLVLPLSNMVKHFLLTR